MAAAAEPRTKVSPIRLVFYRPDPKIYLSSPTPPAYIDTQHFTGYGSSSQTGPYRIPYVSLPRF